MSHRFFDSLRQAWHYAQVGHRVSMVGAMIDAWREHPSEALGVLILAEPPSPHFADLAHDVFQQSSIIGLERLLKVMRRHLNDPRLTPLILGLLKLPLEEAPVTRQELCELWTRNKDPSGALEMTKLGAPPLAYVPLDDEARAFIARLEAGVSLLPELEGVYADPEADAPRRVLADLLLERGDPWGQLIALQLDAQASAQESQLRTELDARLSEPLGSHVAVVGVERGFPVQVRASLDAPLAASPAWRVVRELSLLSSRSWMVSHERLKAFLEAPELSRVHTVTGLHASELRILDPARFRPSTLGVFALRAGEALYLGTELERFDSVRVLKAVGASVEAIDELAQTALLDRVRLMARSPAFELEWSADEVKLTLDARPNLEQWAGVFAHRSSRLGTATLRLTAPFTESTLRPLSACFGGVTYSAG